MEGRSDRRAGIVRYAPVILWACLILAVSSIPNLSAPGAEFKLTDKVAHFIEFSILGFLLAFALAPSGLSLTRRKVMTVLAAGVLFGLVDETYQFFIPGREADLMDVLADTLGVGAAVLLWHVLRRRGSSPTA
jgi:glycopeptide antibiotics resistance protein